jgi:hypothetical protein
MKNIVVLGLLATSTAFADGDFRDTVFIPARHEHRVNFGLLNLGYERIKSDSVYVGIDVNHNTFWNSKGKADNTYRLDHFLNGEIRVGYNFFLSPVDSLTPYVSIGHTIYTLEKAHGNTKNLSLGSGGIKYLHRFGETFEMGIHVKGCLGFSQKRYLLDEEKRSLVIIDVDDSIWLPEFGIPMNWHVGQNKNWEIQFEPYYVQIPNIERTHVLGSRLALGYRF